MTAQFNPPKPPVFPAAASGRNVATGPGILQARATPLRASMPQVPPVFRPVTRPLPPAPSSASLPAQSKRANPVGTVPVVQRAAIADWRAESQALKLANAEKKKSKHKAMVTAHQVKIDAVTLSKMPHLAGESKKVKTKGKAATVKLTGGHILKAMKAKYGEIWLDQAPVEDAAWHAYWATTKNDITNAKWSSFFPAAWTEADVVRNSKEMKIPFATMGGTMYPTGFEFYKPPGKLEIKG